MIKILILGLISLNCYPNDMEKNIVMAIMSYDQVKNYKKAIEYDLNRKIGKNSVLIVTYLYNAIENKKLTIPIYSKRNNYVLEANENLIHIYYTKEF